MELLLLCAVLAGAPGVTEPEVGPGSELSGDHLYATALMRAAPGRLMELIDLVERRGDVLEEAGEARPLILRHSQGDHWDLMLIQPIESMGRHFSRDHAEKRKLTGERKRLTEVEYHARLGELVSWREETFYRGPEPAVFARATSPPAGYFHVEMFVALPGKHAELLRQRKMENDYLHRLERPQNLVFTKTLGGPWDLFTLGMYRDLKHFADRAVAEEVENEAAVAAGFESASMIGPYMRSLIARHNDTIGGVVR
jgi:hypothetical protein